MLDSFQPWTRLVAGDRSFELVTMGSLPRAWQLRIWFGACLSSLGCHAAAPALTETPAPARAVVSRDSGGRRASPEPVLSLRTSLEVSLPDRSQWRVDDEHERWLVARHPATRSELRLRTWTAPRVVRADDCERQARLWRREIPSADEQSVVTRVPLPAPSGFRGDVVVLVSPDPGGAIDGAVLGFGAAVGRCFAVVFTTQAAGDRAEDRLARRLERVVVEVLASVRVLGVEDRGSGLRPER